MPGKKSAPKERIFTRFNPLHDRILVERAAVKETVGKTGLIVAPEGVQEEPNMGTVLAVGDGAPMLNGGGVHPPCVKPGDVISFEKYVGIPLTINEGAANEKHLVIIADSEILGVWGE